MKALTYLGQEKAVVLDYPLKRVPAGMIRVKIHYCGVCGTDISIFRGTHPRAKAPLILGHECSGRVIETPKETSLKMGDRVLLYPQISCGKCFACRNGMENICEKINYYGIDRHGGMAEYLDVSEDYLLSLPDCISDKAAAVLEPFAVARHALERSGIKAGDTAFIIGAGPIGLLLAIALRYYGVTDICFSEINRAIRDRCTDMGFPVIDPNNVYPVDFCREWTGGDGADYVFECSGSAAVTETMTLLCHPGGTICVVATHKKLEPVRLQDVMFREIRILGIRGYSRKEYQQTVDFATTFGEELEKVVSHIIPLEESEKVFDLIADPLIPSAKVLIDCQAK